MYLYLCKCIYANNNAQKQQYIMNKGQSYYIMNPATIASC